MWLKLISGPEITVRKHNLDQKFLNKNKSDILCVDIAHQGFPVIPMKLYDYYGL